MLRNLPTEALVLRHMTAENPMHPLSLLYKHAGAVHPKSAAFLEAKGLEAIRSAHYRAKLAPSFLSPSIFSSFLHRRTSYVFERDGSLG